MLERRTEQTWEERRVSTHKIWDYLNIDRVDLGGILLIYHWRVEQI